MSCRAIFAVILLIAVTTPIHAAGFEEPKRILWMAASVSCRNGQVKKVETVMLNGLTVADEFEIEDDVLVLGSSQGAKFPFARLALRSGELQPCSGTYTNERDGQLVSFELLPTVEGAVTSSFDHCAFIATGEEFSFGRFVWTRILKYDFVLRSAGEERHLSATSDLGDDFRSHAACQAAAR